MIEAYDPGHFRDIRRLGLSDFEMKFPVRMSVADEYGRIVVDARCHPTELSRPSVIAASQREMLREMVSHLPSDGESEGMPRFDRLRRYVRSDTPEDMQPMGVDDNVDVLITNPEELTQENCLQAQAALLINPNLIGDASTTAEHLAATINLRPCSCVTTELAAIPEPGAIVVVWAMEDFDVASYPGPGEKVVPFVLSASMVLLNLVCKSRDANAGNASPAPRTHRELLGVEVTLLDAWMLLTRCPQVLAKHVTMKAAAADMRALMLSELYQIVTKEWEENEEYYATMTTDVGLPEVGRLLRVHVDSLTNGPRPSNRRCKWGTLHLMDKDETREVIRHVIQNLAPKLIHEAFCEPTRKKPPLATHRQKARNLIYDHRKRGEISHKKDMAEFCKSLGLNQQGGHALSQFPTARLDDFYKWRSRNRESPFQTRPLISAHMK